MNRHTLLHSLAALRRCFSVLGKWPWHLCAISVLGPAMFPAAMIMFSLAHKSLFNAVEFGEPALFLRAVLLVVGAVLITCGIQPATGYLWTVGVARQMDGLRRRAVSHVLRLPRAYFDRHHSGETLSRLGGDLEGIRQAKDEAYDLLRPAYWGIGSVAVMYWLDWRLATLLLVLGVVESRLHLGLSKSLRRSSDRLRRRMARLDELLLDLVAGLRVVKVFGIQSVLLSTCDHNSAGVVRHEVERAGVGANMETTNVIFGAVNFLGVLTLGALLLEAGDMDLGTVVAVVGLQEGVSYLFSESGVHLPRLQTSLAGAARALSLLDTEPEHVGDAGRIATGGSPRDAVVLEDVHFSYQPAAPVLRGLSMRVPRGAVAALVGESGGGKSTIVKLLMGLYTGFRGRISVEGVEVRPEALARLRELSAYVPQSPYLFHGTVGGNIRCARPEASEEAVRRAVSAAQLDGLIASLSLGIDSPVGELGAGLSGGERQRVGIARAVLKDAPLLLLDEATASVDAETEETLHRAMAGLTAGRTTIIVAHRLSTVRRADVVFLFEDGRVAASGTHAQLEACSPSYRRLVMAQCGDT